MSDNFRYAQLQPFNLAGAGAIVGATSIILSSMKDIDGNVLTMATDFGTIGYGTVEPGAGTLEEQISFTGLTNNANGTTTLTGVSNVAFVYPYTETSGLAKTHAGGTKFVVSNTSGYYNKFVSKDDDETINGTITFASVPNSTNPPVNGTDLANKNYVLSVVGGGTLAFSQIVISGTAGETVAAGDFVYLKPADGRWWKTTASTAATVENVILGISQGAGTAGNAITTGVLTEGLAALTGLTANTKYYFSNTAGAIATSTGTTEVTAGYAISTTQFVFAPKYDQQITEDIQDALTPGGNFGTPSASNAYITQAYNASATGLPVVHVYTPNTPVGSSTTQFDITNTVGSTYRYTYDGNGTDPSINVGTFPIGTIVDIQAQNFAAGNKGFFTTTGVGANYFEITNASGVVESNKTIGTGYINKGAIYTKPANLKYVTVEVIGGGGGGGGGGVTSTTDGGIGTRSLFATSLIATGGNGGTTGSSGGTGGTGTGGDINSTGQAGASVNTASDIVYAGGLSYLGISYGTGGNGAAPSGTGTPNSGSGGGGAGYVRKLIAAASLGTTENYIVGYKGLAGVGNGTGATTGNDGSNGVIILTEYFS